MFTIFLRFCASSNRRSFYFFLLEHCTHAHTHKNTESNEKVLLTDCCSLPFIKKRLETLILRSILRSERRFRSLLFSIFEFNSPQDSHAISPAPSSSVSGLACGSPLDNSCACYLRDHCLEHPGGPCDPAADQPTKCSRCSRCSKQGTHSVHPVHPSGTHRSTSPPNGKSNALAGWPVSCLVFPQNGQLLTVKISEQNQQTKPLLPQR